MRTWVVVTVIGTLCLFWLPMPNHAQGTIPGGVYLPLVHVPLPTATPLPATPTPTATMLAPTVTPTATLVELYVCSSDFYNCTDFDTQPEAQAAFEYCVVRGAGDIHKLDQNNNNVACESLPLNSLLLQPIDW